MLGRLVYPCSIGQCAAYGGLPCWAGLCIHAVSASVLRMVACRVGAACACAPPCSSGQFASHGVHCRRPLPWYAALAEPSCGRVSRRAEEGRRAGGAQRQRHRAVGPRHLGTTEAVAAQRQRRERQAQRGVRHSAGGTGVPRAVRAPLV